MRLKHQFFLALLLLTTVPLLVLLFGVVDKMEQEVKARTEAEVHAAMDKMATELDSLLNHQKSIAKGLSRVPAVRNFATASATKDGNQYQRRAEQLENFFLNYQHAVPSIQALRFIGVDGKTLVKVKEGKPIEAFHIDDRTGRLFTASLKKGR